MPSGSQEEEEGLEISFARAAHLLANGSGIPQPSAFTFSENKALVFCLSGREKGIAQLCGKEETWEYLAIS